MTDEAAFSRKNLIPWIVSLPDAMMHDWQCEQWPKGWTPSRLYKAMHDNQNKSHRHESVIENLDCFSTTNILQLHIMVRI